MAFRNNAQNHTNGEGLLVQHRCSRALEAVKWNRGFRSDHRCSYTSLSEINYLLPNCINCEGLLSVTSVLSRVRSHKVKPSKPELVFLFHKPLWNIAFFGYIALRVTLWTERVRKTRVSKTRHWLRESHLEHMLWDAWSAAPRSEPSYLTDI